MVESSLKSTHVKIPSIESEGDAITLRDGQIEGFHFVSPGTDPDGMRLIGALGEIMFEEAKKIFRTKSMFVVAQNEDFNLIMFPNKDGFVVWKTNLTIEEALESLSSAKDG